VPGTARQQVEAGSPVDLVGSPPVRAGGAEGTPMQELRLVAVSEDGTYVVLAQPGRASRFSLPNDERLRAVVRGQFSRLAQYEIEVESPLRPKEIQARIRSGETAEQIADAAGVPIERVRWFEGPVLAERAYIAQQAQTASVRRPGDPGPGPRLGEIVAERLHDLGADPQEAQWDSRKRGDGSWLVELTSAAGLEPLTAAWVFDPRRRHAIPDDDQAARLSLPEEALLAAGLAPQQMAASRGGATVTPFVPRSHPAAPRPGAGPGTEAVTQRMAGPAAQPASVPASHQPIPQPAQAGRDRGAGRDPGAEPGGHRHRSAGRPEPQPSPSALPRLQPPAGGPGRDQMHVPAAPQAPEPDPGLPAEPAAGLSRRGATEQPPAGAPAPAAAGTGETPAAAQAAQEPADRGRPARKAAGGRGRRSSVPTWDEIMFGSSRRQD
jgi:Protein of unknown function (DUF3071)